MRDVIAVCFPAAISETEADKLKARIKAELGDDEAAVIVVGAGATVHVFRDHPFAFVPPDEPEPAGDERLD